MTGVHFSLGEGVGSDSIGAGSGISLFLLLGFSIACVKGGETIPGTIV